MSLFEWNDSYSVKVDRCDNDHKKLFSLINDLHEAMKEGKGREVIANVASELAKYTQVHFSAEEGLMAKAGYPNLSAHKAEHAKFVEKVGEIQSQLAAGITAQAVSVSGFLTDWLKNHIRKTDQLYSQHLNAAGIR